MKTFKLIVKASDSCITVLKYISKRIVDINRLGVRIHIEKISGSDFDEEMVGILRKRGIVRLPVLIAPDGVKFTGIKDISELFEKNLKTVKNNARIAPANSTDLNEYWMEQMKMDNPAEKSSTNDDMDEKIDFDSQMRAYRERVPKHRGGGSQQERNIEPAARPRRGNNRRPLNTNAPQERAPMNNDNISEDYPDYDITPNTPVRNIGLSLEPDPEDPSGGEMDRKMLDALMDKFD